MYVTPSSQVLPTINETEASITVKMVQDIDCGEYRLKLSNDCGSAHADIITRLNSCASLPDDYSAGINLLATIYLYAQSF